MSIEWIIGISAAVVWVGVAIGISGFYNNNPEDEDFWFAFLWPVAVAFGPFAGFWYLGKGVKHLIYRPKIPVAKVVEK